MIALGEEMEKLTAMDRESTDFLKVGQYALFSLSSITSSVLSENLVPAHDFINVMGDKLTDISAGLPPLVPYIYFCHLKAASSKDASALLDRHPSIETLRKLDLESQLNHRNKVLSLKALSKFLSEIVDMDFEVVKPQETRSTDPISTDLEFVKPHTQETRSTDPVSTDLDLATSKNVQADRAEKRGYYSDPHGGGAMVFSDKVNREMLDIEVLEFSKDGKFDRAIDIGKSRT